jgi:cytochrome c-type biogenesis protein CcmH
MALAFLTVALTLGVLALLLIPMIRARGGERDRVEFDLTVYRDQMRDLERDLERGVITATEAEAARTEIGRRILAADDARKKSESRDGQSKDGRPGNQTTIAVFILIALPLAAGSIYFWRGNPTQVAQPFAERLDVAVAPITEAGQREIDSLRGQIELEGGSAALWVELGQAHLRGQRFADAGFAFDQAVGLEPENPDLKSLLAEAMTAAAGGNVTPPARLLFEETLKGEATNVSARFYLGLQRLQAGDRNGAYQRWLSLYRDSPDGAPWLPQLHERLKEVAADLKIELDEILAAPISTVGEGTFAAVQQTVAAMNPGQRENFIRSMVARLASRLETEPDDAEGWADLGRAYRILGDGDEARAAFLHAANLFPENIDILSDYAGVLAELSPPGSILAPDLVAVYAQILILSPEHPEALFFSGLAAVQTSDATEARLHWTKLLGLLEPDSDFAIMVRTRIGELPTGG